MRDVRIMAGISSVGEKEMDRIINKIFPLPCLETRYGEIIKKGFDGLWYFMSSNEWDAIPISKGFKSKWYDKRAMIDGRKGK